MLPVVHWFPLHVPRGFQTPLQNSSAPSPESSCLWTQAIFFFLPPFSFLCPLPLVFYPRACSNSAPLGQLSVDPRQPCQGTHWVAAGRPGQTPAPTHDFIHGVFSDSSKPLCRSSPACRLPHPHPPIWQSHPSPGARPADLNHPSLSLLFSINPITCGWGFPLRCLWSRSLPPPCPCVGLVSPPHGPPRSLGCPGGSSQLQLAKVLHPLEET